MLGRCRLQRRHSSALNTKSKLRVSKSTRRAKLWGNKDSGATAMRFPGFPGPDWAAGRPTCIRAAVLHYRVGLHLRTAAPTLLVEPGSKALFLVSFLFPLHLRSFIWAKINLKQILVQRSSEVSDQAQLQWPALRIRLRRPRSLRSPQRSPRLLPQSLRPRLPLQSLHLRLPPPPQVRPPTRTRSLLSTR